MKISTFISLAGIGAVLGAASPALAAPTTEVADEETTTLATAPPLTISGTNDFPAASFFDVFVEINLEIDGPFGMAIGSESARIPTDGRTEGSLTFTLEPGSTYLGQAISDSIQGSFEIFPDPVPNQNIGDIPPSAFFEIPTSQFTLTPGQSVTIGISEPMTLWLLGAGWAGAAILRRRRGLASR
jgi:hypothetical protein